jgi:signal transduction histidine kinase
LPAQQFLYVKTGDVNFDRIIFTQQHFFQQSQFDSALHYANAAMQYAQQHNSTVNSAVAHFFSGQCYTYLNNYSNAGLHLLKALQLATTLPNKMLLARVYYTQAVLANYESNNELALSLCLKSDSVIQNAADTSLYRFLPYLYSGIGYFFDQEQQFDKSILYHKKAYASRHYANDSGVLVMIYQNFFVHYINLNQPELAVRYLDTATAFNASNRNSIKEIYILNNYGLYYEKTGNTVMALKKLQQALTLCAKNNIRYFAATINTSISKIYYQLANYNEATVYAQNAITQAKELNNLYDIITGYKQLSLIKRKQQNYPDALAFTDSFQVYTDSLQLQDNRKKMLEMEVKYEAAKKEKAIAELTAGNKIAVLKRNRLLVTSAISFAALLIVTGLLYRYSTQKQKLAEKEKQVQQQQIAVLQNQQQVISMQSMIQGQETERTRIAKDLHDDLGGLFSTVKMYLSTLEHQQPQLQHDELFKKSVAMVDNAAVEVRRVAHNMMPEALQKMGLVNAVKDMCDSISAARQLQVSFEASGMEKRLPQNMEIMLYRIIKELLNNTVKHAAAKIAIVQLIKDGIRLNITVEDDGKGFDTHQNNSGTGIETVKSRVQYLNGSFNIESVKNIGTTIMMEFLLTDEQHG